MEWRFDVRYRLALIFVLPLVTTLLGCGTAAQSPSPTPSPRPALTGTFTLKGPVISHGGPPPSCEGSGGYSDVKPGMSVTVTNEAGTIIATGTTTYDHGGGDICGLAFEIATLPEAKFYSIELGRRGALTYSAADLAARNWHVDFTLGN